MLVFPTEFRQSTSGKQYPAICFAYISKDRIPEEKVFLPMPAGLEISDSMQFDTINLGLIGDTLSDMVIAASKGSAEGMKERVSAAISAGTTSVLSKIKGGNAAAMLQLAAARLPGTSTVSAVDIVNFGTKQVLSPNSNTSFQNSTIRTFNFRFKMVARSAEDSDVISGIVDLFRENMYPAGSENNLILEFPGTWYISFLRAASRSEPRNVWIPAVYESYLTSFSSTYNSTTNMFHEDDSPVEVDIAMSFQEVKALNRGQIEALNQGKIV